MTWKVYHSKPHWLYTEVKIPTYIYAAFTLLV